MDLDAFVAAHRSEWARLRQLVKRRDRLSGSEADELVRLYRATSTHVATVRSAAPDPVLLGRLSALLAQARTAIAGAHDPGWGDVARFLTVSFPAAVYQSRRWWLGVALGFSAVAVVLSWWIATDLSVQAALGTPEEIRQLVEHDFENYYSQNPAGSFAAQVWINNTYVAAACLAFGVFLGIPVIYALWVNVLNLAASAGVMAAAGRLDIFFGLITPHGLLELTAVFVAAGAGLRMGWTVVDPGPRRRSDALAEVGRATLGMSLGLAGVLLISGVIEAFVTGSSLPTWARIAVGVLAEGLFLAYVWIFGRRAVLVGESGDLDESVRGDALPTAR